MIENYAGALVGLGVSLTELAVKGTATAVANRVKTIQDEKNVEKLRNVYDEIINELLSERDEAVRIAQAYKDELDRVTIGDDDIKHLHETISKVIDVLKAVSPNTPTDNFEPLKDLISVDTLKTMQLLGFNYKAAIGEPLTQVCAEKILNVLGSGKATNMKRK